jgi:hypothetical protein
MEKVNTDTKGTLVEGEMEWRILDHKTIHPGENISG